MTKLKSLFYIVLSVLLIVISVILIGAKLIVMFNQYGIKSLIPLLIVGMIFIIGNYFWKKWQKTKQESIFNKYPFDELISKGFIIEKKKEHTSIHGLLSGYHVVIVFFEIGFRYSNLAFFIEFHPKSNNKILTNEDLELLISKHKRENLIWKFHHVFYTKKYKNTDFATFVSKIELAIKILQTEDIQPISEEETNDIKTEIEQLIDSGIWNRKFL